MDMDCESVPSSLQSSPVVPPPLLPPVRLPTASLNLKLDAAKVAIDWAQLTGNARPVFSMPRTQLAAVAPAIPSAASLAASVSPTALPGLGLEAVPDAKPAAVVVKPTSTLPSAPPTAKPSITKSKKASSSKRPRSGKSNDKRPRFKGRFVKQEELERLQMEEEQSLSETSETAVVPDSMLLW